MPQDQLGVWSKEFENIPPTADTALQGAKNLAEYVDKRVSSKLEMTSPGFSVSPKASYAWQPLIFANILAPLVPVPDPVIPATIISNAWASAASLAVMFVGAGVAVSPPPPPSTGIFSAPPVVLINAASLVKAQVTLLNDLIGMGSAGSAAESELPEFIRKAFASLRYDITGIDSTTPTPLPIVVIAQIVA